MIPAAVSQILTCREAAVPCESEETIRGILRDIGLISDYLRLLYFQGIRVLFFFAILFRVIKNLVGCWLTIEKLGC